MNYRKLVECELKELLDNNPEYTFGDILYSIFRLKSGDRTFPKIKEMSDEDMYTLIHKANEAEGPETPFE